jgi:phosphatidylinositol glycan class Q protein
MVLDIIMGICLLFVIKAYSREIVEVLHYFGHFLHIEVLERQVKYLMNLPAGFKANPNLDNFLGNFVLDIISVWNQVTTELTDIELSLARYFGMFGVLGISFQLALTHDYLFLTSIHIFIIYTGFSAFYKFILKMSATLFKLFQGSKFNVLRQRVDQNHFQIQELYLGVLMIILVIFLTPTIAMYYYFCFIFIIVTVLIDQMLLLNLQNIANNFPTYLLVSTLLRPYSLPNSYTLHVQEGSMLTFKMVPNACNRGSVFSHLVGEFKNIYIEAAPSKIVKMIFSGDNLFYAMRDLLNITNRQQVSAQPREEGEETLGTKVRFLSQLIKMITSC